MGAAGYPEVRAARLAGAVLAAAGVAGDALMFYVVSWVLGAGPARGALAALAFAAVGAPFIARALSRPRVLAAKLADFESLCGGRMWRFAGGVYPVYYCDAPGGLVCYDPVLDEVRVVVGAAGGEIEAPPRRDYRCVLHVRGRFSEAVGGLRVFRGSLYAPAPGRPGRMTLYEGVEAVAEVACGRPSDAARRALQAVGGARG